VLEAKSKLRFGKQKREDAWRLSHENSAQCGKHKKPEQYRNAERDGVKAMRGRIDSQSASRKSTAKHRQLVTDARS